MLFIRQVIAFILSNSRFLFRNKWLHNWLEEDFCSSDLYSASQLYYYYQFFFDSLSSENIACSRSSCCKTKCTVNGTIVTARQSRQSGKKVRLGSSRVESSRVENGVHPTRPNPIRPNLILPRFFTLSLLSCSVPFAPFY